MYSFLFALFARLCQLTYTHVLAYERLASEWPRFLEAASLPPSLELPWENKGPPGSLMKYFANITRYRPLRGLSSSG